MNGRALCWGNYDDGSGSIGTVYADIQAIAECLPLNLSCVPIRSVGFISFSDNIKKIEDISASDRSTCGIIIIIIIFISLFHILLNI